VVVHYLDLISVPITPYKAEPPLIVDPDSVLAFPVAAQRLQAVSGRRCQIAQLRGAVQLPELSAGSLLDGSKAPARLPPMKPLGLRAPERPNHSFRVSCLAFNVKQ